MNKHVPSRMSCLQPVSTTQRTSAPSLKTLTNILTSSVTRRISKGGTVSSDRHCTYMKSAVLPDLHLIFQFSLIEARRSKSNFLN